MIYNEQGIQVTVKVGNHRVEDDIAAAAILQLADNLKSAREQIDRLRYDNRRGVST